MKFALRAVAALLATGTLAASAAWAEYPDHSIQMIVPFTAGGPTDNVARALADSMGRILKQSIIVENKGGAGGTIGTSYVARARPDGYELLLMHVGFTTAPALYKNPGYDAINGFEPIGLVVDVPMTIIARKDFPPSTITELAAYVKTHKDKVTLANAGIGAASHLCSTMLISALGTKLLTVPYKGTAPAMNDLLGGQVDMMCDQTTNTTQQIAAKTVKSYAVTSLTRVPTLPDLPTMDESGFKGFQVGIWHALWAPKGTPKPVVDKLVAALQAGLKDPKFQQRMSSLGATVLANDATPEALRAKVAQQVPQWADLFKKAGVQAQ
jgi:tripartite-type tricarboxylate transporter receptor subunit TctC